MTIFLGFEFLRFFSVETFKRQHLQKNPQTLKHYICEAHENIPDKAYSWVVARSVVRLRHVIAANFETIDI